MAVVFRLRGTDGKFVKGEAKNLEKAMTSFGSKVVKEGRAILNQKKKRTEENTLFNEYHYTMKSTDSTITMGFDLSKINVIVLSYLSDLLATVDKIKPTESERSIFLFIGISNGMRFGLEFWQPSSPVLMSYMLTRAI